MTRFELPDGDGEKTVFVRFAGRGGIESGIVTARILLKGTPPTARITGERVAGENRATFSIEAPEAVVIQFAEEPDSWGPWENYSSRKSLALSPGEGPKTVFARVADEAGNLSEISRVNLDVAKRGQSSPHLASIFVTAVPGQAATLDIRLSIEAIGMVEMESRLDGAPLSPRSRFSESQEFTLPRAGMTHRIRIWLWDGAHQGYSAEVAFQEPPPEKGKEELSLASERPEIFFAGVKLGVWLDGPKFSARTAVGTRDIESGSLGLIELGVGMTVLDPFFVEISYEGAFGKDATIASFGLSAGATLYEGWMIFGDGTLDLRGGLLLSTLDVSVRDFGSFDLGTGFRLGFGGSVNLSEHLSVQAEAEFLSISYHWSGESVMTGDSRASSKGVEILLGLTYRF
jgi:hypothetical protein